MCRALSSSKRIKRLVLSSNNLKMARSEDIQSALENVTSLNLANTQLSISQLVSVLRAYETGGKIQELNLSLISPCPSNGLIHGPMGVIADSKRVRELAARVIPNCRRVQLRLVPFMGGLGWNRLFLSLIISSPHGPLLEELDISKNDLSKCERLPAAVTKILRVKLMETKLTKLQSSSIFKRI